MKNVELNVGGLIGALACGAIAAAVIFSTLDPTGGGRKPYRLIIYAVIGGAFAGNFLWALIFKKSK